MRPTVDFTETEDDRWIVLDTGDGQVSGLATETFADVFFLVLGDALDAECGDPK